ncbi:MAG: hypothetical protein CFH21_00657 [Alphaproteobacteria bacterium MarineAlpha5_Bin11]|nr:hypothetical protein [Pelagibacteraceae bacterium]PPR43827.1 MAG: hypothetical protein CFH21_00657 [Alphaproteobacteria bacterium MarineAlpha5_Bin11]PPR51325.1 MAG: hypothetical protein CFH20_00640 [Alphaproteobacteria bacterium MarineAlpha5_Bin10]|tara:strand:+ start:324 stop:572 length:249 start_codon:yes stop_codon:yes gene_type:complete
MKVLDESKKQLNGIIKESRKHFEDQNESYFEHMKIASKISFDLLSGSVMAMIHAIVPAFFQTGASKKIIKLNEYLQSKKRSK